MNNISLQTQNITNQCFNTNLIDYVSRIELYGIDEMKEFMALLESTISSAHTTEDKKNIMQQIESIEKLLQKEFRSTLLSKIIARSPEFAIKHMAFFASSINRKNGGDKKTPLIEACRLRHFELVKTLIEHGADVNLAGSCNETPLGALISETKCFPGDNEDKIFDLLLKNNCNVNAPIDMVRSSPLIYCCNGRGLQKWAWKLLPLSDINQQNNLKLQALHLAVRYELDDIAAELIKRGAQLNTLANPGITSTRTLTPCHIAVAVDNPEILKLLLDAGANPHLRAVNPYYPKSDQEEPLSPYVMSVDDNRKACTQIILEKRPPSYEDCDLGFTRNLLNTPMGKKITLSDIAESQVLQFENANLNIGSVNLSITEADKQFITLLMEDYFLMPQEDGASLYLDIWKAVSSDAKKNKNFTIYFSPSEAGSLCGKYNPETKSHITIYYKTLHRTEVGEAMVHEMAHKCEDLIYKNLSLAPENKDHPFYNALKKDLENLSTCNSPYASYIKKRFNLSLYSENCQPQEAIVRIPQVIFGLIHQFNLSKFEVEQCMKACLPHLFDFYLNDFLPACRKLALSDPARL